MHLKFRQLVKMFIYYYQIYKSKITVVYLILFTYIIFFIFHKICDATHKVCNCQLLPQLCVEHKTNSQAPLTASPFLKTNQIPQPHTVLVWFNTAISSVHIRPYTVLVLIMALNLSFLSATSRIILNKTVKNASLASSTLLALLIFLQQL